jgi:hypothetical protein
VVEKIVIPVIERMQRRLLAKIGALDATGDALEQCSGQEGSANAAVRANSETHNDPWSPSSETIAKAKKIADLQARS